MYENKQNATVTYFKTVLYHGQFPGQLGKQVSECQTILNLAVSKR